MFLYKKLTGTKNSSPRSLVKVSDNLNNIKKQNTTIINKLIKNNEK
jgi:hypothetical protein